MISKVGIGLTASLVVVAAAVVISAIDVSRVVVESVLVAVSIVVEIEEVSAIADSTVVDGFAVVAVSRVSMVSVLVLSSESIEEIVPTREVVNASVSVSTVAAESVDKRVEVVGMAGSRVELVAGQGLQTLATVRLAARATMQKGVTARILGPNE